MVALREESVDRNWESTETIPLQLRRSPRGENSKQKRSFRFSIVLKTTLLFVLT